MLDKKDREKKYRQIETAWAEAKNQEKIFSLLEEGIELAEEYHDELDAAYFKAEKAFYLGDYQVVQKLLTERAERLNDEYLFCKSLGISLSSLGQKKKAIEQYELALKLKPNDHDLYREKGLYFFSENKLDDALSQFEQSLSIEPADKLTKGWLGEVYFRKKNYQKAAPLLSDGIQQPNQKNLFLADLVETMLHLQHYESALNLLESGLEEFQADLRLSEVKRFMENNADVQRFFREKKKKLNEEILREKQRAKLIENLPVDFIAQLRKVYDLLTEVLEPPAESKVDQLEKLKIEKLKIAKRALQNLIL